MENSQACFNAARRRGLTAGKLSQIPRGGKVRDFASARAWCRPCSVCFVRFALCLLFLCAFAPCASTMELGQTKESIVAQHGPATEENHSKNTAVYRSGPWKVDLQYHDGIACRLTFS